MLVKAISRNVSVSFIITWLNIVKTITKFASTLDFTFHLRNFFLMNCASNCVVDLS